jgi:hypothetical protein
MYNVILTRVRPTIFAVEKQYVLYILWCVCSLRYPACNAQERHGHLWPVQLYNIFRHYPIHGIIFEKKVLIIKCVF